mmetsp:Transcript_21673/g.52364  ORF Transcript_21673/g.52364 Transcript_21673/m.52364 type:complete len:223 (+) Transcript_21673:1746-2414(+)
MLSSHQRWRGTGRSSTTSQPLLPCPPTTWSPPARKGPRLQSRTCSSHASFQTRRPCRWPCPGTTRMVRSHEIRQSPRSGRPPCSSSYWAAPPGDSRGRKSTSKIPRGPPCTSRARRPPIRCRHPARQRERRGGRGTTRCVPRTYKPRTGSRVTGGRTTGSRRASDYRPRLWRPPSWQPARPRPSPGRRRTSAKSRTRAPGWSRRSPRSSPNPPPASHRSPWR